MNNEMNESYILELLGMPKEVLAKMVWGLQQHNKELEDTLLYSRIGFNETIERQRKTISELMEQQEAKNGIR